MASAPQTARPPHPSLPRFAGEGTGDAPRLADRRALCVSLLPRFAGEGTGDAPRLADRRALCVSLLPASGGALMVRRAGVGLGGTTLR
jgi:hypothetical protein